MDPVDEFARIRSEIKALEERAKALRAQFLEPGSRLRSNSHEVVIRHQTRRVFQRDLLPPEILNDPKYWVESSSAVVTVRPMRDDSSPKRKGKRGRAGDDFDVFE